MQVNAGLWDDFKDTVSTAGNDAWSWASDSATWDKLKVALVDASGNALDWTKEAWVSSTEGAKCLKEAMADNVANKTAEAWKCRDKLYSEGTGGTNVATFNTFLGAGIAIFIFARAV